MSAAADLYVQESGKAQRARSRCQGSTSQSGESAHCEHILMLLLLFFSGLSSLTSFKALSRVYPGSFRWAISFRCRCCHAADWPRKLRNSRPCAEHDQQTHAIMQPLVWQQYERLQQLMSDMSQQQVRLQSDFTQALRDSLPPLDARDVLQRTDNTTKCSTASI